MESTRVSVSLALICLLAASAAALDAVAIYHTKSGARVKIYDQQSGASQTISNASAKGARFSPDGRKVAFTDGNSLYLMNIDVDNLSSSNETKKTNAGRCAPSRGEFSYTTNGIFWYEGTSIIRYDIDRDERSVVYTWESAETRGVADKGYFGSYDGGRAWIYNELIAENQDRNGHGDMAYVKFNADFTGCTWEKKPGVGYGHLLLMGGTHLMIGTSSEPRYRLLDFDEEYPDDTWDPPQISPVEYTCPTNQTGNPGFQSKNGINPCINNWKYVVIKDAAGKFFALNMSDTTSAPIALKGPSGADDYTGGMYMRGETNLQWTPDGAATRAALRTVAQMRDGSFMRAYPSHGAVRFVFSAPVHDATLSIYTVSGKLVAAWTIAAGCPETSWYPPSSGGRPAARYTAVLSTKSGKQLTTGFAVAGAR